MAAAQEPTLGSSPSEAGWIRWRAWLTSAWQRVMSSWGICLVILLIGMIAACSRSPVQPRGGATPTAQDQTASVSQTSTPPKTPRETPPAVAPVGQNPEGSISAGVRWRPASGEEPAVQTAMTFLKSLSAGNPQLDLVSGDFLRIVGRPWERPGDREQGYSALAAESWFKRASRGWTLAAPIGTVGREWAFLSGSAQGENGTGQYYLLLRQEGQNWKVDHLVLSSANLSSSWSPSEPKGPSAGGEREEQDRLAGWMLQCWLAALADRKAMSAEDRAVLVAAALSGQLRQDWAAPFDSDQAQGYDFNRGRLQLKIAALTENLEQFYLQPLDPPRHWQIEGKGNKGSSKRWVLTLEQAPMSGRWFIQRLLETP